MLVVEAPDGTFDVTLVRLPVALSYSYSSQYGAGPPIVEAEGVAAQFVAAFGVHARVS